MTVEQYWHGDPKLLEAYYKTYLEGLHQDAHIYGYYQFIAVSTALSNAFREKGKKAIPYLEKPIEIFKERKTKAQVQSDNRRAFKHQASWVNALSNNK